MPRSPSTRPGRRAVSMTDVAAHARVSQKTVSRVVNGEPYVREQVRQRVLDSIKELDFRPNAAARSLVTRRTRRIGVVALGTTFHGPAASLAALESVARADGYSLSIHRTDSTERADLQSAVNALIDDGVEGIVLSEPMLFDGRSLSVPESVAVLTLGTRGLTDRVDELLVGADEEAGARLATEHLLTLGHETVHHIAGPDAWVSSHLRRQGWTDVLEQHGAEVPQVVCGDWTPRSGFEAMTLLLGSANRPTAVFVANDQMAIGALSAITRQGLTVPGDISLIGFDDIDVAEFLPTPLSTLRQEFAIAAHHGMDQLIRRIDGSACENVRHLVPLSFVDRATTAPPPQSGTAYTQ